MRKFFPTFCAVLFAISPMQAMAQDTLVIAKHIDWVERPNFWWRSMENH